MNQSVWIVGILNVEVIMESEKFVSGLSFSPDGSRIVLITKLKPDYMQGKLAGVGGKIEPFDSSAYQTMVREFEEETGCQTFESDWKLFAKLEGNLRDKALKNFEIYFFSNFGYSYKRVRTITEEAVRVYYVRNLDTVRLYPNMSWLIPMALSFSHGEKCKSFLIRETV